MIKTIISLLEEEPIEDGMIHPADKYLQQELNESPKKFNELVSWYWANEKNGRYIPNMLRCIGRLEKNLIRKDGMKIMANALTSTNVETREAAVSALENWGGQEAIETLSNYVDSENIKWLKKYANKIIMNLQQSQ